jgi:hypothetical protein
LTIDVPTTAPPTNVMRVRKSDQSEVAVCRVREKAAGAFVAGRQGL